MLFFDLDALWQRDPLPAMLPLADDSWDLQVQRDAPPPSTALNIGFALARAGPRTAAAFQHMAQQHAAEKSAGNKTWDQVRTHAKAAAVAWGRP